jgi:REP element-mobilizing transposase RayT
MERGVFQLRSRRCFRILSRALSLGSDRFGMRVTDYSVLGNHMHLIVEADDRGALSRGMQGLGIRIAKGLNRLMERKGRVFSDRFHARVLRTPREVRAALCYVLNNFRRHAVSWGKRLAATFVDPYSSAAWFDGWRNLPELTLQMPAKSTCASPTSWLRRIGWRRHHPLIEVAEVPGALPGVPA